MFYVYAKHECIIPWSVPSPNQYPSHRREERLAAQIARSKESRQDTYMRGREEFLASAITSAGGSFGGHGGSGGGGHSSDRDRSSMGIFAGRMPVSLDLFVLFASA